MKKIFLLALIFLSCVFADEYNLSKIYSKNLLGNDKFIGNTVLEVNKSINYPAIYLNGDDNRVIIYDDGNYIVVKDKYNNIVKFIKGKVDITKKQKKYQFINGYIKFKDDYKKVEVKYNGEIKIKVDEENKEAEWTKFNNGCLEGHSKNNNFCYLKYVNIDNDSSLIDSSSSDLTLPVDSKIVFAGLYWSGLINKNDKELENSKSVLFRINDNKYVSVTVSQNNSHNENESYYYDSLSSGYVYSAFKNITDLFSNYNPSSIKKITVANVLTEEGINVNVGNFGAWALVVVYEDKNQHYKNITIYNSFLKFYKISRVIKIDNLLTPLNGKVYSKISYFVSEGDINKRDNTKDHTDKVEISTDKNETYINISPNENNTSAPNYYTDVMDSTITTKENRNPEIENNMGIDIDTFDIGKDGNNSHKQIIDNGVKSVNIKITTGTDAFYLNNIVFATDLYRPNVCYDGFKLYKDGKLVDSNNKLYVGDKVDIEFNIKNMGDEEAKYVYIIDYDNNFTKYVKNSTLVKNVLSTEFKKLTDNDDTVNPHVIYKNGIWNVGIIGDENNIFKPTSTNSGYIATIKLSKSIENEGNISFDFYTDYNYTIGDQTFRYNDYLPKCEEFNNNYSAYNTLTGTFDAFDVNKSLSDRHITTKIVNKPFTLKIVSLNAQNNGLETKSNKFTRFALWDMNNDTNITNWYDFNASQYSSKEQNFTINRAYKNVKIMFKFCAKKINNDYYFYPYNDCNEINCVDENDTSICIRRRVSSDAFAIRPDHFLVYGNNQYKRAGEEFNITIKAVDINGSAVKNYNEILKINNPNSPTLEYNETKNGCLRGVLTSNPIEIHFINGEANLSLKYSEVGDVNLTIKEINGSEFAKIDANDTNWNNRKIADANVILHFIPYKFDLNTTSYNNFNNSNFTYISNDLNMSSVLNLNIKAVNKTGLVTQNYNKKCYAKNININITHSIPLNNLNLLYEVNGTEYNISNNQNIVANNITKDYFNNGLANIPVYINFERKPNTPENEFNFTINDINVSNIDNVEGNLTLNQKATFRYGFLKVKNVAVYDRKYINSTINYYYYSNNGWQINKDHNSTIFGDLNLSKIYKPSDININIIKNGGKNILNGTEEVNISTSHALPYSAKIHLAIPSWLWYHPLAKPYKDPSSTNQDCLTHPCLKVTYLKSGSGWAGIGSDTSKYSEKNTTVEFNTSKELNATKNTVRKLNW